MRFLRRYARAHQARAQRFVRPSLEPLEIRLAMSSAAPAAAGVVNADAIVVEPDLQPGPADTFATALDPSSTAMRAQTSASAALAGFTPQQIRAAYGNTGIEFGSIEGNGSGQTIAIVDAYDDPDLIDSSSSAFGSSDLARFDQAFGLPDPPSFVKLNEYGSATDLPATDPASASSPGGDWELEEALDVEWAHAIGPAASITLIETNSDNGADMYTGATTAAGLAGVSVVSMSWGSSEFAGEQSFDSDFTTPSGHQGVTFVASTGDNGAPGEYPAFSPNVVAVGGTTLSLSADGSYGSESAWSDGGGGISALENEPAYQQSVQNSGMRTIPDIAFDANPSTGAAVYDSFDETGAGPWSRVGGTSLSAPCVAALIAIADQGRVVAGGTTLDGPGQTIPALYAIPRSDFNDVTAGGNGVFAAGPGYDEATGLGTPRANWLVSDLASYGTAGMVVVTAQPPATVTAGSEFGLAVMVENPNGSLETNYIGNVTVALANNPGDDVLGGTITVAAQGGIATFSNLTLDRAASGATLIVNAGGTAIATTTAITVAPAAAAQLVVITGPTNGVMAGATFSLIVAVEDVFGNLETSFNGDVSISLKGGPGKSRLSGPRVVTVTSGRAIFSGLLLKKAGARDSIRLTAGEELLGGTGPFKVLTVDHKLSMPQIGRDHVEARRTIGRTEHHANKRA